MSWKRRKRYFRETIGWIGCLNKLWKLTLADFSGSYTPDVSDKKPDVPPKVCCTGSQPRRRGEPTSKLCNIYRFSSCGSLNSKLKIFEKSTCFTLTKMPAVEVNIVIAGSFRLSLLSE